MTDDQLNELLEAMRAQTETMNSVTNRLGDIGIIMAKTVTGNAKGVKDYDEALGRLRIQTEGLTKLEELALKQKEAEIEREANRKAAAQQGVQAVRSFTSALLNTEAGFQKYEGTIKSTTSAVSSLLSNFGAFGKALGVATAGLGELAGAVLKQTDAIVKSYDDLAEIGGAAAMNAEQISDLGRQAGFTSHNIGIFTKNTKEAGANLVALGGSASQGIKTFSRFAGVGEDTLKQYRRLGITQEGLIESQSIYIRQQSEAGQSLRKSPEQLQKASLAYIDQLNVLSELTGISVKKQQEALDIANANENFNAYKFAMDQKALALEQQEQEARKAGNTQRADELKAQAEQVRQTVAAKDEFAKMAVSTMSASNAAAVLESISTSGATIYTENNAKLLRAGIDVSKMNSEMNQGRNQTAQLLGSQAQAAERFNKTFGEAGYALGQSSKELQNVFGIDNKMRQSAAQFAQLKTEEERQAWLKNKQITEQNIEAKKKEGQPGQEIMDATATKEALERQARRVTDALIEAINPFRGNVLGAAVATAGMMGAATAATLALSKLAASAGINIGGGGVPGPAGTPSGGGGGGGKGGGGGFKGMASKALGFVGRAAAPVTMALGAAQAYSGYKDVEAEEASGKITAAQATVKKSEAVGEGAGTAIGGVLGGALGSIILPGIGTIAGAALGSWLGGLLGKSAGTEYGESKAKVNPAATSEQTLLDLIGSVESRGNYNILVGGKTKSDPPLTEMTVGQVLEFQSGMRQMGHESTAVGKYQIIRGTLAGLFQEGVVNSSDKFDQSTQDKLAIALLKRRGLEKYKEGKLSPDQFADNIAKEWASLPAANGQSYYAGTGSNKSLIARSEVLKAIGVAGRDSKESTTASAPEQAMPMAARGGIFSGSISGYPVELHGDELVAPIDPNSVLAKMLTAGPGQAETLAQSSPIMNTKPFESDASRELIAINTTMLEMMSNKLDTVIDRLGTSNDIQDKLLKYSSV